MTSALVDKTVARFGRLDVAVNNAGTEGQLGTKQTAESYAATFDTNVLGVLSMKHELRVMQGQGSGNIINISTHRRHHQVGGAGDRQIGDNVLAVVVLWSLLIMERNRPKDAGEQGGFGKRPFRCIALASRILRERHRLYLCVAMSIVQSQATSSMLIWAEEFTDPGLDAVIRPRPDPFQKDANHG